MHNRSKLFLLAGTGGGGTNYIDSSVVATKTTITSIEAGPIPDDISIVKGKTTVSGVEVSNFENAIILGTTTLDAVFSETYNINTFNYDWNTYDTSYDFDGSIPVSGSVGANNDDQGFIS